MTAALEEETDHGLIARHLDELAWIRWRTEREEEARSLLTVAERLESDAGARRTLNRARVESLFAPYLAELRVVEQDALASEDTAS